MKKAMRKLRQKIADELAGMLAEQIPAGDTLPMTPRGIQAGNIAAFEVVLKWIDEMEGNEHADDQSPH